MVGTFANFRVLCYNSNNSDFLYHIIKMSEL
jgi:hypothetical protein